MRDKAAVRVYTQWSIFEDLFPSAPVVAMLGNCMGSDGRGPKRAFSQALGRAQGGSRGRWGCVRCVGGDGKTSANTTDPRRLGRRTKERGKRRGGRRLCIRAAVPKTKNKNVGLAVWSETTSIGQREQQRYVLL